MDAKDQARQILQTMLGQLGFEAEVSASEEHGGDVVLNISSADESVIAGAKGEALNDWQVLVNRLLLAKMPEAPKVRIDAGHLRERQEADFRLKLRSLADKAKRTGGSASTRPLNSWYRRLAHQEFEGDAEFQIKSEPGDKRFKTVTITFQGIPKS